MVELVSTGVEALDELLDGGFEPGSSVLFYGPPGDGKSFIMWKTAASAARAGRDVVYFSLHHLKENKLEKMDNLEIPDFEMVDTLEFREQRSGVSNYVVEGRVMVIDSLSDLQDGDREREDLAAQLGEILFRTKKHDLVTVMSLMHHPSHRFPPFLEKMDYLVELSEELVEDGSRIERTLFVRKTPRRMHERRYRYTIRDDEFVVEDL